MVNSLGDDAFAEIQKGLDIVNPYLNLFKSQPALSGVFGIVAMGNKKHDLKEILGCSPDKFGNPQLLETVTLVSSALEKMNDAVDNLPKPDLGIFDWRLHYQDGEWKEPLPLSKLLDRYDQVTGHWIHVLEDLLNPEKNSDPKFPESVLSCYPNADSSTIVESIRGDLKQRQSLPEGLEETLKNLCLEKYAKDFETIKDHILSGCSQVSRLLLEKLDHIEQWLSSEEAEDLKGGDKERMGLLRSGIAIKRKYLATSCRETALLCLQLMVPPQLGRILGGQDQEGPSQADLRNSLAYLTGLSEQMVHLLEIRKELDQLKTHQAERKHFEREFPKTKEELQQRLKALIYPADQGSSVLSQQYRQSQGR
jgi:hypothetical protein